jgi:macrolide transport system ATP-binding/permease protein
MWVVLLMKETTRPEPRPRSSGVPIVRGRNFTAQDTPASQQVVLVNQAFSKHFFPGQNPIGKRFGLGSPQYSGAFEIAGVFADFKMTDPRGDVGPLFFRPLAQRFAGYKEADADAAEKTSMFAEFMILDFTRAPQDAEALARKTLADVDRNLTVIRFHTYDWEVAGQLHSGSVDCARHKPLRHSGAGPSLGGAVRGDVLLRGQAYP